MRRSPLLLLSVLALSLAACPGKPKEEPSPSADAGKVMVSAAGVSIGGERLGDASFPAKGAVTQVRYPMMFQAR
jgi:hypothetical protein